MGRIPERTRAGVAETEVKSMASIHTVQVKKSPFTMAEPGNSPTVAITKGKSTRPEEPSRQESRQDDQPKGLDGEE